MIRNKVFVTIFATVLLLSGLFLLYTSNINKTLFVDVSAENPLFLCEDKSVENIQVQKNSHNNYIFLLPSNFLYQTKTIYLQNTNNENLDLKLYTEQKIISDKKVEFSIQINKIKVNGNSYNNKKQTVWYERPYINTVTVNKDEVVSLTVKYKTKLMLRNIFMPQFIVSIVFFLISIILLLCCWYKIIINCLVSFIKKLILLEHKWDLIKYVSIFLWIFLVGISCYTILKDANWILGDDYYFISPLLTDSFIPMPIWPSNGRFFPLSFQEFNLLRLFSLDDPLGYYCISCLEFLITVLFFTLFLKDLSKTYTHKTQYFWCVFFVFLLIISRTVLYLYMDVIFPERNVLCMLSLFLFFYWRGINKESLLYICIAAFFAVMSFYYKEPMFGLFSVFCLCPFIFDYKNVSKYHKIFSSIIFINIILYLILYYFIVYLYIEKGYNEGRVALTHLENFIFILKHNKFFIVLLFWACFRFIRITIFHEKKYLITDSLLFSGVAYFFAYIVLKLNNAHYFTSIYILALPSIFIFLLSIKNKYVILLICILLVGTCCNYNDFKSTIIRAQLAREMDMKQINFLSEKVDAGYEIFYFQIKNTKPENAFDNAVMNYWHSVVEIFLEYSLKDKYKIKIVDELFPLSEKEILISPNLVTKEREIDFSELGDVTSFKMYRNILTVYEKNNDL